MYIVSLFIIVSVEHDEKWTTLLKKQTNEAWSSYINTVYIHVHVLLNMLREKIKVGNSQFPERKIDGLFNIWTVVYMYKSQGVKLAMYYDQYLASIHEFI